MATEATTPDKDQLQEGDQTTPEARTGAAVAGPAAEHEAKGERENAASQGPGGHQDAAGDVQHEGGPNDR